MAANPIALLAQGPNHQYGRIGLPQNPPQNPPTPAEVIEAVRLANRALRYRGKSTATKVPLMSNLSLYR